MSQRVLAEVVSQYLEDSEERSREYLAVFGEYRRDLEPLLGVVRLLRQHLVPVEPSPQFAAALKAGLLTASVAELPVAATTHPSRLVIGAVAFGSVVSAAAVYLFVTRTRTARAA